MSKNNDFQRVFSKNYLKMNSIIWSQPELFIDEILKIRSKFGVMEPLTFIDPSKNKERYSEIIKQGSRKMKSFHKRIGAKASIFYKDLGEIRKNLHLGREWNTTLARVAVSGIFLPPPFSVFTTENDDEKTITFELNEHSTQDDLNLAWKNIEDIRKKMYGKTRANFPTKKGIDNFNKITALKVASNNEEVAGSLMGDKKYKKRKIDVIAEIYSDEDDISEKADKKRLNKLKIAEHRLKRVTS